jgi:hypothetical protein
VSVSHNLLESLRDTKARLADMALVKCDFETRNCELSRDWEVSHLS